MVQIDGAIGDPGSTTHPQPAEEADFAVQSLKSNKAPGADETLAELLKFGATGLLNAIYQLVLRIWGNEEGEAHVHHLSYPQNRR